VATYGTEQLQELEGASVFLEAIEEQDDVSLTDADRAYLKAVEAWLDMYPRCGLPSSQALSVCRKGPIDSVEEVGIQQVKIP